MALYTLGVFVLMPVQNMFFGYWYAVCIFNLIECVVGFNANLCGRCWFGKENAIISTELSFNL
jgi:hypothetical protein